MHPIYRSLTGLRGILALGVACGHFGVASLFEPLGLKFHFHFAVDLFFILSGFVLAGSNYYTFTRVTAYVFFIKRIARLVPLHFLTLGLMVWLNAQRGLPHPLVPFLQQLLLIHNIGLPPVDASYNHPAWSISVEYWGSLLLLFVTRVFNKKIIMSVLWIYILFFTFFIPQAIMQTIWFDANIAYVFNAGLLRCIGGMSLGVLLFLSIEKHTFQKYMGNRLVGYLGLAGLLIFFFCEVPMIYAPALYLFAGILIGQLAVHPTFLRVLNLSIVVGLGEMSYTLYLLHIPLYCSLQTFLGDVAVKGFLGKCILLPLLLLLSWGVYRFFERPMQQQIRALLMGKAQIRPATIESI